MWNSISFNKPIDNIDVEAFFRDQLTSNGNQPFVKSTVFAISRSKTDGTFYAAVRFAGLKPYQSSKENSTVMAFCCEHYFDSYSEIESGCVELNYRITCESNGPKNTYCDPKILKLLTPTFDPRANEWRNACLKAHKDNSPGIGVVALKFFKRFLAVFNRGQRTEFSV